jgi:hypothetical protein
MVQGQPREQKWDPILKIPKTKKMLVECLNW